MKPEPIVRPVAPGDAAALAARLRKEDAFKVLGERGMSLEQLVEDSIVQSIEAWVWEHDGAPACMWGFVKKSLVGSHGVVAWMLTTPAVAEHPRTFWRGSQRLLQSALERFGRIDGHCDARFLQSVAWLKRLGFTLDEPEEIMGVPFRHFAKEIAR